MAHILLVNPKVKPSKRKRKRISKGVKSVAKKRRTAAQKAATRKLVALNRGKGRSVVKTSKRRRKRNPIAVSARRTIRSHRRARRSNPITSSMGRGGLVGSTIMPAAIAAGGAISLDLIWGLIPLPDSIKVGSMRHVAKAVGAIGLGMLAGMVVKKDTARALATGALTVVMYNAARDVLASVAPSITLGEHMALQPASDMQAYLTDGVSGYGDGFGGIGDDSDDYSMAGVGEQVDGF